MIQLPHVVEQWEQPEFRAVLKEALAELGHALPLQAGLSAGSYALEKPLDVMVISTSGINGCIEAKVAIFYPSLMPGCACAGDPTVEDQQTERITVLVSIDQKTAEATFELIPE